MIGGVRRLVLSAHSVQRHKTEGVRQGNSTHRVGRQGGQLDTLLLKVFVLQGQSSNLGGTHRLQQQSDLLSAEYKRTTGRNTDVVSWNKIPANYSFIRVNPMRGLEDVP